MISEKHSAAARANGARSRGPKTPEGLARCSGKEVRQSRLSDCVVLEQESRDAFQTLFNLYVDRFEPLDDVEFGFVEEMVSAYWRLRRNWAIETRLLDDAMARQSDPGVGGLAAGWSDLASGPRLAILQHQEARLHAMLHRAVQTIAMLRHPVLRNEPKNCPVSTISEIEGPKGPSPAVLCIAEPDDEPQG